MALGEPETNDCYLLVCLQKSLGAHLRLRGVFLSQPDFAKESPVTNLPGLKPPFLPTTVPTAMEINRDQRTTREVADYLKPGFRHFPSSGQKTRELRWVATCLTIEHPEDSASKYVDGKACAYLFAAVDTLTHFCEIRHLGLKGQNSSVSRGLLVLVAYALQHVCKSPDLKIDLARHPCRPR